MLGISIGVGLGGRGAGILASPVISDFSTAGAPDSMSMTVSVASTVYWLLDANATRTAAQIIAGGGDSDGSQSVTAGAVNITLDFSAVADGSYYIHVVADNGSSSNVIDQAVELASANLLPDGSFDNAGEWNIIGGAEIVVDGGGLAVVNTLANFRELQILLGSHATRYVPASQSVTLDVNLHISAFTSAARVRGFWREYTSAGVAVGLKQQFIETNTTGVFTLGDNIHSLTPLEATCAYIRLEIEFTILGSDFTFDDWFVTEQ